MGKVIPSPLISNLIYLEISVNSFVFVCSILEQLQHDFAAVPSDITKAKLIVQIRATEEQIKIESIHRITGFNQVKGYEILSGAPGLGKRS